MESLINDVHEKIDILISLYPTKCLRLDIFPVKDNKFVEEEDIIKELLGCLLDAYNLAEYIIRMTFDKIALEEDVMSVSIAIIIITFQVVFESDLYPYGSIKDICEIFKEYYKSKVKQNTSTIIKYFFIILDTLNWKVHIVEPGEVKKLRTFIAKEILTNPYDSDYEELNCV